MDFGLFFTIITIQFIFFILLCYYLYNRYKLQRNKDIRSLWRNTVIAHRGYRGIYNLPENSLSAWQYAVEHGATALEVDIMLTVDNHIVVFHDSFTNRVCEETGNIYEMTVEQVNKLTFKKVTDKEYVFKDTEFMTKYAGQTHCIPTLQQCIEFCRENNLKLMIDLKEAKKPYLLHSLLVQLFEQYNMYNWSYIASFHPLHLYNIHSLQPRITCCLLYCVGCLQWYYEDGSDEMSLPSIINYRVIRWLCDELLVRLAPTLIIDFLGLSMIGPHNILVSQSLLDEFNSRKLAVDIWCVNSSKEKSFFEEIGKECAFITTDNLFEKGELE